MQEESQEAFLGQPWTTGPRIPARFPGWVILATPAEAGAVRALNPWSSVGRKQLLGSTCVWCRDGQDVVKTPVACRWSLGVSGPGGKTWVGALPAKRLSGNKTPGPRVEWAHVWLASSSLPGYHNLASGQGQRYVWCAQFRQWSWHCP